MIKSIGIIPFLLFLILSRPLSAQEVISLEEALAIALEHNFAIRIAQNQKEISELNNTPGNAGMLPSLSLSASHTRNQNNTYQEYFDGRIRESPDARSNTTNAGVQLNWTLFDGMKMFITKEKLEELEQQGEIAFRMQTENLIASVTEIYHALVIEEKLLQVLLETIKVSADRKSIALRKYELGSGSELSYLQAAVDLNADSAMLMQQNLNVQHAKRQLNVLLGNDPTFDFIIEPSIAFLNVPPESELWNQALNNNPELLLARSQIRISELEWKEARTANYPGIDLNSGYSYLKSASEVGILQSNRNLGLSAGLSLRYTIFDGMNRKRAITLAKIDQDITTLNAQKIELDIKAGFSKLYQEYFTNLQLMRFEEENQKLANRNFNIAIEKYRLGAINDIELRETQLKLLDAGTRYLSAQYRSKLAETELLRLAGFLSRDKHAKE